MMTAAFFLGIGFAVILVDIAILLVIRK